MITPIRPIIPSLQVETDPFDSIPMGSAVNLTMRLSFDEATEEEANWPTDRKGGVVRSIALEICKKIS